MHVVLLATDFSERSDRALRRAVLLARETGARLHLLHVVDDDRPRRIVDRDATDASTLLAELAHTLESIDGVCCDTQVIQADPFAGIAKAVSDVSPDLLVLGPHRRQILRDEFVGTTAERTIRSVNCPVLMVNGPPVGPYQQTLLTTDLSDSAQAALQRFALSRIGMSSRLAVLHVFDAPALRLAMADTMSGDNQDAYLQELRADARRDLARCMSAIDSKRRPEQIVRHMQASVAHEILTTANDVKANLVVVSTQGKNVVERIILGSVTEQILQSSPIDVLVMPASPATSRQDKDTERTALKNQSGAVLESAR